MYRWSPASFTNWSEQLWPKLFEYRLDANPPRAARAYALVAVAAYDSMVACWDAKYTYWAPRPYNLDPSLVTVLPHYAHPSYPSAHGGAPPPTAAPSGPSSVPGASAVASPSAATAAAPRPTGATLTISSPTPGQTLPAGSVQVSVEYSGPALVPAANATKLDDYHLHYFLDVNPAPYIAGGLPAPFGISAIVHTAELQHTFDNVSLVGSHTLTVMLSGANHVSVEPPLSAQVAFSVQ